MDLLAGMLTNPLMQRALIAAVLVGLSAPVMGTYLVQRRLALLGDGIGHMALTGVALGWLVGAAAELTPRDALAVPGAVVAAVVGAIVVEVIRERGKTSGDLALAMIFYGGIAGGVLLIGIAGGTTANLNAYLFGSIAAVTLTDLWLMLGLAVVVLGLGLGLRPALFVLSHDDEFARASGLPVRMLNVMVAVLAALTVSVAMRVVGVLLVSAVMIVPVGAAQLLTRSFRATMTLAMGIGVAVSVAGLSITFVYPVSPGATIVVLAIGVYVVVSLIHPMIGRRRAPADPHPDMQDDVELHEAS